MPPSGDERPGRGGILADELGARRQRQRAELPAQPTRSTPPTEDPKRYELARGLSSSALPTDQEELDGASADETLARHVPMPPGWSLADAPPPPPPQPASPAGASMPAPAAGGVQADEILRVLENHHQRVQPTIRQGAPRGSADLQPPTAPNPKPPRPISPSAPPARRSSRITPSRAAGAGRLSSRLPAAVAIALSLTTAIVVIVLVSGTPDPKRTGATPVASIQPRATTPSSSPVVAVGHVPAAGAPKHPVRRPRNHRPHKHGSQRPVASVAVVHAQVAPVAPTYTPPASYIPPTTSPSTRSAAADSSGAASPHASPSSSPPAGPAGPGATLSSNCNPKCS